MKLFTSLAFLLFLALLLSGCAKFHSVNQPSEETTIVDPVILPPLNPDDDHDLHPHDENGHCKHRKEHNRHGHNKYGRCLHND